MKRLGVHFWYSPSHPHKYSDNLLGRSRIQHQLVIRDEQVQNTFFTCSFFPNASIAASVSTIIPRWIGFGRKRENDQLGYHNFKGIEKFDAVKIRYPQ
jgi:hypothetical protein